MIDQASLTFKIEASEILADLETRFLELEDGVTAGQIDTIFRALHTVKGSGAMFGYTALAEFTHHFENAYELVRSGELEVNLGLIELSLKARDLMVDFLNLGGDGTKSQNLLGSALCTSLVEALQKTTKTESHPGGTEARKDRVKVKQSEEQTAVFDIVFRPFKDALRNGMRPDLLLRELKSLGQAVVAIDTSLAPTLAEMDPADAWLGWKVRLTTHQPKSAIEDVFIFADDSELTITLVAETSAALEIAATESDASESLPEPEPSAAPGKPSAARPQAPRDENIRVSSARLDEMMDSLGELVIAQARLDAIADAAGDSTMSTVVEEVQRLIVGLRDSTMSVRMLPIETVFGKFRRVVRDLSAELGKDVRLITAGGETEVDKNVIDHIGDPLVHMIRNSVDHGLETAEARRLAGKPETGTVRLSACQEGGEIVIMVEDNGAGINTEAVRSKAIERGLISTEDDLSEKDLQQLIFAPGFSTAQTVSSVSGRGVGMDVVKTTIDSLGGSIDVTSRVGRGTRICLRLPVTLAIIDGLRVRLGKHIYVIPLTVVEECVEMGAAKVDSRSGRSVLQIRQELVPYLELDVLFNQPTDTDQRRVVVVRADGGRVGLVVDDILGQSQTVVKSLGVFHKGIPGVGGATILGNGSVALILDVGTLVGWATAKAAKSQREVA